MNIKVDDWCLINGQRKNFRNCPIALAIQNTLGTNYNCAVVCDGDSLNQNSDERTTSEMVFKIWKPTSVFNGIDYLDYKISSDDQVKVNEFVNNFDYGINVNTFNFELTL